MQAAQQVPASPAATAFEQLAASPDRRYVMVSGKGGVGKTSLAASLAVKLAQAGHTTLVVSTDPAHSLSDSLDQVGFMVLTAQPAGQLSDLIDQAWAAQHAHYRLARLLSEHITLVQFPSRLSPCQTHLPRWDTCLIFAWSLCEAPKCDDQAARLGGLVTCWFRQGTAHCCPSLIQHTPCQTLSTGGLGAFRGVLL